MQKWEFLKDKYFDKIFHGDENSALEQLKLEVEKFWAYKIADDNKELESNFLSDNQKLSSNMSLNFLHSAFLFGLLPDNCAAVGEEYGERFHQNIFVMESRYQGNGVLICIRTTPELWSDMPQLQYPSARQRICINV